MVQWNMGPSNSRYNIQLQLLFSTSIMGGYQVAGIFHQEVRLENKSIIGSGRRSFELLTARAQGMCLSNLIASKYLSSGMSVFGELPHICDFRINGNDIYIYIYIYTPLK